MPNLERLVFFGTPEFAVPTLSALVGSGRVPVLVVRSRRGPPAAGDIWCQVLRATPSDHPRK